MFMTTNITRLFTSTHNRFAYITRTIRFTNTQWFGMMFLFTIRTFRLRTLQELIDLLTFNGLTCKTFYMSTNIRRNNNTSNCNMVTTVSRFRGRSKNIGQWRKIILLKGKTNSNLNGLFRNITILQFLNKKFI